MDREDERMEQAGRGMAYDEDGPASGELDAADVMYIDL